jgi:hypothetical protein
MTTAAAASLARLKARQLRRCETELPLLEHVYVSLERQRATLAAAGRDTSTVDRRMQLLEEHVAEIASALTQQQIEALGWCRAPHPNGANTREAAPIGTDGHRQQRARRASPWMLSRVRAAAARLWSELHGTGRAPGAASEDQ